MNLRFLVLAALFGLFCVSLGYAQAEKKVYRNIELEKFTVRQGVEFSAEDLAELNKATLNNFLASNRFDTVRFAGTEGGSASGSKIGISGEVIKYVKGSRAARYLVGLGAGKTKIVVDVKLSDLETGKVIFQQAVDGDVTWGLFGGDSDKAKGGVADEIIRVMKKNGWAGEKRGR